jgi:hypothetical protein
MRPVDTTLPNRMRGSALPDRPADERIGAGDDWTPPDTNLGPAARTYLTLVLVAVLAWGAWFSTKELALSTIQQATVATPGQR